MHFLSFEPRHFEYVFRLHKKQNVIFNMVRMKKVVKSDDGGDR